MSDIGGTAVTRDYELKRGRTYQYVGCAILPPVASDKFLQLVKKMKDDGVLDAPPSEKVKIFGFDEGRAAYFYAQKQPFLLIDIDEKYRGKKYTGSFIFDPVTKTYLGNAQDVFMGLIQSAQNEAEYLLRMQEKLSTQSALVTQYERAAAVGHIASAIRKNIQIGFEYMALKEAVIQMGSVLPDNAMRRFDALFCEIRKLQTSQSSMAQVEVVQDNKATTKAQPASGFLDWLRRTLG